jgi:type III secretion protein U
VPVIVVRARGPRAEILIAAAAELGIPRARDHALASALARRVAPGSPLPNQYFDRTARAIFSTRAA